jgi:hypothetical protein
MFLPSSIKQKYTLGIIRGHEFYNKKYQYPHFLCCRYWYL